MQQKIAVAWVVLLIILCLDVLYSPERSIWTIVTIFGVTWIGSLLFDKARKADMSQKTEKPRID